MANTTAQLKGFAGSTTATIHSLGGTGTPAASYPLTEIATDGVISWYEITWPEALVGLFAVSVGGDWTREIEVEDIETTYELGNVPSGGGSVLTGPYALDIVVSNANAVPLTNVDVQVYNAGGSESKPTVTGGIAAFAVEADTFNYTIRRTGFTSVTGTITITGHTNLPITITAISRPPSTTPGMCNAYLRVLTQHGKPLRGASVEAKVVGHDFAAGSYIRNLRYNSATNDDGEVVIEIYKDSEFTGNAQYEITIDGRHSFLIDAPSTDTMQITQKVN